jgi:hypothetical protein
MATGFIIMQIGNPDMDRVCFEAIVPAVEAAGLQAIRVDKHNSGGLLKAEIVHFIEEAEIIVADLTNERPNCYLEIGYAMGLDKFRNLILTAREDHNIDSPSHVTGGPKIHFDLSGYDVLFWSADDLTGFRAELEKRIGRRQAILPKPSGVEPFDEEWTARQREAALPGLERTAFKGHMEVRFSLVRADLSVGPAELLRAADSAQIHAFGWPIAVVLRPPDLAPKPRADGISAEIVADILRLSYDYWALRRNGDFYLLHSLYEDGHFPDKQLLFFDTRITRVTEVLLYCRRLYERLGVSPTTTVNIEVVHGGIAGRVLTASSPGRHLSLDRKSIEERIETRLTVPLSRIESDLTDVVKVFTRPLFELFDFFELNDSVLSEIVDGFVADVRARG